MREPQRSLTPPSFTGFGETGAQGEVVGDRIQEPTGCFAPELVPLQWVLLCTKPSFLLLCVLGFPVTSFHIPLVCPRSPPHPAAPACVEDWRPRHWQHLAQRPDPAASPASEPQGLTCRMG